MAEAVTVMVVAAAAAVAGRRSRQSGVVGRHGRYLRTRPFPWLRSYLRTRSAHTFEPAKLS